MFGRWVVGSFVIFSSLLSVFFLFFFLLVFDWWVMAGLLVAAGGRVVKSCLAGGLRAALFCWFRLATCGQVAVSSIWAVGSGRRRVVCSGVQWVVFWGRAALGGMRSRPCATARPPGPPALCEVFTTEARSTREIVPACMRGRKGRLSARPPAASLQVWRAARHQPVRGRHLRAGHFWHHRRRGRGVWGAQRGGGERMVAFWRVIYCIFLKLFLEYAFWARRPRRLGNWTRSR